MTRSYGLRASRRRRAVLHVAAACCAALSFCAARADDPVTPVEPAAPSSLSAQPALTGYPVDAGRLEGALEALRQEFSGRADVRVIGDPNTSQIYLFAPPEEHTRVGAWIKSVSVSETAATPPPALPQASIRIAQQPDAVAPAAGAQPPATRRASADDDELLMTDANEAVQQTELLRRLGFDVQIEVLPGQDALVLRGRDADVEAVAEIIREIERTAALAKPEIEIIPLKQTPGLKIVEIFTEVQEAITVGRQGRVTIKSLGTPNAILIIGWGEAFGSAKSLIEKLDQPVKPQQQIRAFHLQHTAVANVRTVVQEFFTGRDGMGPAPQLVADQRSNTLIVHASPRDLAEVALLIKEVDVRRGAAVKQVRVLQVKHALATDLAATLTAAINAARGDGQDPTAALELLAITGDGQSKIQSGLLNGAEVTANSQTNTLILSAPQDAIPLLEALVERLDQPVAVSQIKVFRITHGDANSLVLMLRALLPTESGQSPRPQLPGVGDDASSLAPLRFAVEQRTNSIIASGSASDLQIVHALLLRLDEDETQRRSTTVYRLKNAPAEDVARAVNEFLSSERQVQQVAPGEGSAQEQLEREVIVVPEPVSNSLILSATRRFYDQILELVEQLDSQPPQVVIQVLIAQIALNDADEFGVEMGLQDSVLFDRSLLGDLITTTSTETLSTAAGVVTSTNEIIQSATNTPGFDFVQGDLPNSASLRALDRSSNVGGQGITTFSVGRVNDELGFGGLVLSASSESVSLLIRALQQSRRLDILSRPQVTTLDNQQAFIQVGQRVPRITSSTLSAFGQTNAVELENVGLILVVTPRTSPNGMVVMEVDAERSEVGSESDGIPISTSIDGTVVRSPRIDITTAQTTVTAASGETIVLGGLITRREDAIHRRVPLLADIPLLGDLFRYDFTENLRSELLIILTPHIVRGPEDMQRIRELESSRMHWCAADVQAIHGGNPLYGQAGEPFDDESIPTIYPDSNPRGVLPTQSPRSPETLQSPPRQSSRRRSTPQLNPQ